MGKLKEKALSLMVEDYLKRIKPYHKIEVIELKDLPSSDDASLNLKVIEEESLAILKELRKEDYVILLDLKGKNLDSLELSNVIQSVFTQSFKNLVFVIGGSLGVSDALRKSAHLLWKLSDLTFPHGLVRLLLTEQIYRSFKILNNQTYHK